MLFIKSFILIQFEIFTLQLRRKHRKTQGIVSLPESKIRIQVPKPGSKYQRWIKVFSFAGVVPKIHR